MNILEYVKKDPHRLCPCGICKDHLKTAKERVKKAYWAKWDAYSLYFHASPENRESAGRSYEDKVAQFEDEVYFLVHAFKLARTRYIWQTCNIK